MSFCRCYWQGNQWKSIRLVLFLMQWGDPMESRAKQGTFRRPNAPMYLLNDKRTNTKKCNECKFEEVLDNCPKMPWFKSVFYRLNLAESHGWTAPESFVCWFSTLIICLFVFWGHAFLNLYGRQSMFFRYKRTHTIVQCGHDFFRIGKYLTARTNGRLPTRHQFSASCWAFFLPLIIFWITIRPYSTFQRLVSGFFQCQPPFEQIWWGNKYMMPLMYQTCYKACVPHNVLHLCIVVLFVLPCPPILYCSLFHSIRNIQTTTNCR